MSSFRIIFLIFVIHRKKNLTLLNIFFIVVSGTCNIWICHKNTLVKFEFGHGLMKADKVIPLELWKNQKFLVSVHYLLNGCTHSPQIWLIDTSKEKAVQFWIWSWFNDFGQSYPSWMLEKFWFLSFSTHTFVEMYVVIILATNMQFTKG
jgi:hypothetical protein